MLTSNDRPLKRSYVLAQTSQRGSCSATYETPTQKQVVYEWFSTRCPTNVRCVTGEGAAAFPAAPRVPGRRVLRTGPRSRRAAGARRAAAPGWGGDAGDGRPAGTAGDRLSEADRGSLQGLLYWFLITTDSQGGQISLWSQRKMEALKPQGSSEKP
ncbi:hypothetical protein MJG53_008492 [Ovis ammon polii x Ovis aries]|uniref:Uncharacterized protein n=1 Tax=Ovis ammon polii x Ovis aries TaxID=2918886 RepID=A0ACB9UZZ4_9CETA|nr:hypothetical protein MJG53_008492 [Ovis ammon polii x Ovis aries]